MEPPDCPACSGPGNYLGHLGKLAHFRCRNCGIDFSHEAEDVIEDNDGADDEPEDDEDD